jgi:hypothetical protein
MNRIFDYNGRIVAPSNPVKSLTTVKKMLAVDSGDRDTGKYKWNNDFVIYLPRVYENVVSIRLVAAEFPNSEPLDFSTGTPTTAIPLTYFMLDIEGLNKSDECSTGADRSGYPDGYFAKIPTSIVTTNPSPTSPPTSPPIFYSDHTNQENSGYYTPPIGKLDRMHIRVRRHEHRGTGDSLYWTDGTDSLEFSLTFQVEMLDNTFDDFSSFESRISTRAPTN